MFLYPKMDYMITGIRCGFKHQIHEATMCFTKRHFGQMGGFICRGKESNQGEGTKMVAFNEKNTINLDIRMIMICVSHDGDEGNTIPKDRFSDAKMNGEFRDLPQLEILKAILD